MHRFNKVRFWFCLLTSPILLLMGAFTLGRVLGAYSQSEASLFSFMGIHELGIWAGAICAAFILVRTIKEAKLVFGQH